MVLIAQFWTGFSPVGYADMTSGELVEGFFQAYLSVFIVLFMYIGFKTIKRPPFRMPSTIDLVSGVRDLDLPRLLAEERAEKASWPAWKRAYKVVC